MKTWTAEPQVLSRLPGRLRIRLPAGTGGQGERFRSRLATLPGVKSVQVNALTGNLLVRFEPATQDATEILNAVRRVATEVPTRARAPSPATPAVSRLARGGVRGFLAHAVFDSVWFAADFLGSSVGLPLAGLGPLHVLLDVVIWGLALGSAADDRHPAAPDRAAPLRLPGVARPSLVRVAG